MSTLDPIYHRARTSVHAHVTSIPSPQPCPSPLHAMHAKSLSHPCCALLPMSTPCLCLCPPLIHAHATTASCPCLCLFPSHASVYVLPMPMPCPCLCTSLAHVYSMIVTLPMSVFSSAPRPCRAHVCVLPGPMPLPCPCPRRPTPVPTPCPSPGIRRPCPSCSHAAGVGSRQPHVRLSFQPGAPAPASHSCNLCVSLFLCVTARGRERARHGEREEEGGSFK